LFTAEVRDRQEHMTLKQRAREALLATPWGYRLFLRKHHRVPFFPSQPTAPWTDGVLKSVEQWHAACDQVRQLRLPPHPTPQKNWDGLSALVSILRHCPRRSSRILDAGATIESVILPWLFVYGYRDLRGVNLDMSSPVRRGSILYERADITRTHYPDGYFDAVTCLSVLEHGVDCRAFLTEMARIIRPGGLLIVSVDYWENRIDMSGATMFGAPWVIFDREAAARMAADALDRGFTGARNVDLSCVEKAVHWEEFDVSFTFLLYTFTRNR
jgi:SAM-dependent methyltransferase